MPCLFIKITDKDNYELFLNNLFRRQEKRGILKTGSHRLQWARYQCLVMDNRQECPYFYLYSEGGG